MKVAYTESSVYPHFPDWSVIMQMRTPSPHRFLKSTVLVGQNGTALVAEDANEDIAVQL